jgi:protein-serine/threonine kinase
MTPFRGTSRTATFSHVLHNDVQFYSTRDLSNPCKSIVRKLLIKDEHRRLGSKNGASDVKSHAFFKGVLTFFLIV